MAWRAEGSAAGNGEKKYISCQGPFTLKSNYHHVLRLVTGENKYATKLKLLLICCNFAIIFVEISFFRQNGPLCISCSLNTGKYSQQWHHTISLLFLRGLVFCGRAHEKVPSSLAVPTRIYPKFGIGRGA